MLDKKQSKLFNLNVKDIEIDPRILDEWQEIADLVARLTNVPSCLVMRKNENNMEVMISSKGSNSPYKPRETAALNNELYCEYVIKTQTSLHVLNALKDSNWDHNPDIELGMISYYGVPVNWPNGEAFGTFCILDNKEKIVTKDERDIVIKFGHIIELTLKLLISEQRSYIEAITDMLTGIYNRRYFLEQLSKGFETCKRYSTILSVSVIDLDDLKVVNDLHGHHIGDKLLQFFAKTIKNTTRNTSTFARIGGDEFALLMPHTNKKQAKIALERIQNVVKQAGGIPKVKKISFSAGIAEISAKDKTKEDLLKRADKLLYLAKSEGKGKSCI